LDKEIYHVLVKYSGRELTHIILLLDFSENLAKFFMGYSHYGRLLKKPGNIVKKLEIPKYNYDNDFYYKMRIDNKSITQIIYDYKGSASWVRTWIMK
jgi:hypothetical protein